MIRRMITLGLATLLLASQPVRSEEKAGEKKDSKPRLAGTYTIVAGEREGQKEPEARIKGDMVRFTEDTIIVTDKNKKETYVATYKVDWSKKPGVITMKAVNAKEKDEVVRGLIEKEGDTVRLIYSLPGGEMPTTFKTTKKQLMFVLKAVHKE